MRACLITLNDALGMSIESQWGAFTFLKVPHILRQLHFAIRGEQARHYADISGAVHKNVTALYEYF
jgi:hypothetical protein